MKAAKLEHKAIRCVEWADIPNLHYPLFALVHYNGFTLIAQAIVPSPFFLSGRMFMISSIQLPLKKLKQGQKGTPTLVYGSDDGGKSFVNEDPEAAAIMERLGKKLNLRGHTLSSDTSFRHYGPLDVGTLHLGRLPRRFSIRCRARDPPSQWKILYYRYCSLNAMRGSVQVFTFFQDSLSIDLTLPSSHRHGEKGAHLAFHLRPTFLQKLAEKGANEMLFSLVYLADNFCRNFPHQ